MGGGDPTEGIVAEGGKLGTVGPELETDSIRRAAASVERMAKGDEAGRALACGAGAG